MGKQSKKVLHSGLGNLLCLNDARMESERGKNWGGHCSAACLAGGVFFVCVHCVRAVEFLCQKRATTDVESASNDLFNSFRKKLLSIFCTLLAEIL